jgi:hypothetical protein
MLKIVSIGILSIVLSSGCMVTELVDSAEVHKRVKDVAETVGFVARHTNDVLVPGGAGTLIIAGLGIWYRRRWQHGRTVEA